MTHTKGPWRYLAKDCQVAAADDTIIHEHQEPDNPVAVADALLIASAPDLYAALEQLLEELGYDAVYHDAVPAARAALAKARGES